MNDCFYHYDFIYFGKQIQKQMNETKTFIIVHPTVVGWTEKISCAKIELIEGFIHLVSTEGKNVAILPSNWAAYEVQS